MELTNTVDNHPERIDKVLAHHGFGTRRDVKRLLHEGVVQVNGKPVTDSAFHLSIDRDTLSVDGVPVSLQRDIYLMMNKCADVVCANKDGEHQTVFDLVDEELRGSFLGGELHTIGRLDVDTEGLLILTTDGALTHRLISPKTHVPKTYAVRLRDAVDRAGRESYRKQFAAGIRIGPDHHEEACDCQGAALVWISDAEPGSIDETTAVTSAGTDCLLTIFEGKYHQVKRMFAAVGNEVIFLKRVAMGSLLLDPSLPPGSYRALTDAERDLLTGTAED